MYDILTEIETYKNTWYIWNILGLILSITVWIILSKNVKTAHAKTLREKLVFLLGPYTPKTMLVIDNKIYYDGEYRVTKGEKSYLIQTNDSKEYATDFNPEETARIVNIWGARGPEEVDAPYSLGWRWVIPSMMMVYFFSLGLLNAYNDPRINALNWLNAFGIDVPAEIVVKIMNERAYNTALSVLGFSITFAWWFGNLLKLSAKQIKKSVYITLSSGDTIKLIPALEPDSPNSVYKILKDKITINIPDDIKDKLAEIAKKMHLDMETLVETFSKARLADYWQDQSAKLLTNIDDYKLAAEAEATLKMQAITPRLVGSMTKIIILTAIGMLALGFFIGWGFGSTWGVAVNEQNNNEYTETTTPGVTISPGENETITPAPPPPPPISSSGGG